jgi:N-acetyl-gamma-glutamyl-phosphate reductase
VPAPTTHHPVRAGNLRTYKPLDHQHTPEIVATLTQAGARQIALHFVPVSAPLARGIFATAFVQLPASVTEASLRELYARRYASEPFVRLPKQRLPEVVAVSGSPYAEVGFSLGPSADEMAPLQGLGAGASSPSKTATVFSALDNLIKGGAGQAIQNLNLMLGVPETTSLDELGPFP